MCHRNPEVSAKASVGRLLFAVLVGAVLLLVSSGNVFAIEAGQVDDFGDGTEQNWIWGRSGFGGPIAISGGIDGSIYLETESFGGGDSPGSRMALINREQWTGDFSSAGISSIRMDALNDGPNFAFEDMMLRIGFSSKSASVGSGRVVTSEAFLVARDAGWQQIEFDLGQLTAIAGSNINEVMSSVSEMRILSTAEPLFIGDQVIARLGVDNIAAVTVPEPSTCPAWFALVAFALRRVSRTRKTVE